MFEHKSITVSHEHPLRLTQELTDCLARAAQTRLQRVAAQLRAEQLDAVLLYDPVNIRYATDSSNMQVWTLHNATRYALVFADGYSILWDFHGCEHLTEGNQQIDKLLTSISWTYFSAGTRQSERAKDWAQDLDREIRQRLGSSAKLAVDRYHAEGAALLKDLGHNVQDGEALMERARLIKSSDELTLMRHTIAVAERGIQRMHDELKPGMTENEIWAFLHFENIQHGGEWIETRLLSSGPRTNPWMRESSPRVMQEGDLLSFDTDLIGPFGYCADISRSWTVGHVAPSATQRRLYTDAYQQVHTNLGLLKAGLSYREFSEAAWIIPDHYYKNRYCCIAHGVGMADENPAIAHAGEDWQTAGYDGVFEAGMVVCMESYIGDEGGAEGVKLEQQVLITEQGHEVLSNYPFEESWLI